MGRPDFSEWLTEERFLHENESWEKDRVFESYAQEINLACHSFKLKTILEVGCGAGFVPGDLDPVLIYSGMDRNPLCVLAAWNRNPKAEILLADIRTFSHELVDLVCSFAVLKHFSLEEWPVILQKILSLGKYSLFTIQLREERLDDGEEYHHIWVQKKDLESAIRQAGHKIVSMKLRWSGTWHGTSGEEWLILTKQV